LNSATCAIFGIERWQAFDFARKPWVGPGNGTDVVCPPLHHSPTIRHPLRSVLAWFVSGGDGIVIFGG